MAASSSTEHMYIYEGDDLHLLSERPHWIKSSVNVFTGDFTCASDKEKLVDVVLALYAFSIACGRHKTGAAAESPPTIVRTNDRMWLSALIDSSRKHIFPPEWFGDSVEILEMEIEKALMEKRSEIFEPATFHKLLRARQELCRLHGANLPESITQRFGTRIEEVAMGAKADFDTESGVGKVAVVPPTMTTVEEIRPSSGSRRGDQVLPNSRAA